MSGPDPAGGPAADATWRPGPAAAAAAAVLGAGAVSLALYGVGDFGGGFWEMSRSYLDPGFDRYTRETVLFPLFLAALDAVGIHTTPAGNLVFVVATALALALGLAGRLGAFRAALLGCSLLLSPIGMILFSWAGMPDFLTVACAAGVGFARRPWVVALAAFLGAANHLSQFAFIAVSAGALRAFLEPGFGRRELLSLLGGAVAGAAAVKGLLFALDLAPGTDRLALALQTSPAEWWRVFARRGGVAVYSFHLGHWLLVAVLGVALARTWPRALWGLAGCELLAFAPTLFTQDTTRVFALLTWFVAPVILGLAWGRGSPVPAPWQRRLAAALLLSMGLMLVVPKRYVWNGSVHDLGASRARVSGWLRR